MRGPSVKKTKWWRGTTQVQDEVRREDRRLGARVGTSWWKQGSAGDLEHEGGPAGTGGEIS